MILGVSFDSPAENRIFREEEDFPYRLLSDEDRSVGSAYRAVRDPEERHPDYPRRITYLIDPAGTIARAYRVTDKEAHADDVLADLANLAPDGDHPTS